MTALAPAPAGLAERVADLEARLEIAERRNRFLRRAAALRDRVAEIVLHGGDETDVAVAVAEAVGRPCAVTGAQDVPIAGHDPASNGRWAPAVAAPRVRRDPAVKPILATLQDDSTTIIPPVLHLDARHRVLVGSLAAGLLRVWISERGGAFRSLDRIAIQYATDALAVLYAPVPTSVGAVTETVLAGDARDDVVRRCWRLTGLDPAHGVVVWRLAADAPVDVEGLMAAGLPALTAVRPEGRVVIAAAVPDALRAAGESRTCRRAADVPRAWRELCATAVARDALGADDPPTRAEALGPARLLLATGDRAHVDHYLAEVLGRLRHPGGRGDGLLTTLAAYLDLSQSVGRTAFALGVHENTVRYRIKRAGEVLDRDLTRPEELLAVHVAMLVLRMRGDRRVAQKRR